LDPWSPLAGKSIAYSGSRPIRWDASRRYNLAGGHRAGTILDERVPE
jgi:hypothetical protein